MELIGFVPVRTTSVGIKTFKSIRFGGFLFCASPYFPHNVDLGIYLPLNKYKLNNNSLLVKFKPLLDILISIFTNVRN